MKAIAIDDYGAQPALHDLPVPEPGEGELLVRVRASSVNGFDVAVAGGYLKGMMEYHFPVVLGKDFAGNSGGGGRPGRAGSLQAGDTVFGVVMKPVLGDGTFGEYVAAPAAFAARVPGGLDLAVAGALGLAGTAALNAVDAIGPQPGETVLVSGATGGVGAFAVQLAAARGAQVIATARPGEEEAYLRSLGAHDTVDYTGDVPAAVAALRPDGIHAVVHLAGDGLELADLLVAGGRSRPPSASAVITSRGGRSRPRRSWRCRARRPSSGWPPRCWPGDRAHPARLPAGGGPPGAGRLRRRHPREAGRQRGLSTAGCREALMADKAAKTTNTRFVLTGPDDTRPDDT